MKKITSVNLIIIVQIVLLTAGCLSNNNDYSTEGELILELKMEYEVSNLTIGNWFLINFTNNHSEKIGFIPKATTGIRIYDDNGTVLFPPWGEDDWLGPDNDDIVVIDSGETYTHKRYSFANWEFEMNTWYNAFVTYHSWNSTTKVTKPYWKGRLRSEPIRFYIEG